MMLGRYPTKINECTRVQNPHRYMHAYSMAHCTMHCIFNIRGIGLHTLHLNRVLVLHTLHLNRTCSGTVLSDLWIGGRHLATSLHKQKATVTYFNWIMHIGEPLPVYWLHCHCIDNWPAKHRMVISHVAEVGAIFGASLSEPHINGTAVREFYIIYWAIPDNRRTPLWRKRFVFITLNTN